VKAVLAGFLISIAVIFGFGACAAFDGDPPDKSCRTDDDCFRAQGEMCNVMARVCVCMNPAFGCVQEDAGVAPQEPTQDPAETAETEVSR
jgi:hypothetical protein